MNLNQYSEDSEAVEEFEPESFDGMAGPRLLQPLWKLMFFFGIPPLLGLIVLLIAGLGTAAFYFSGLPADPKQATATEPLLELPREVSVDDQISALAFSNPNRNHYVISGEIVALRKRIKLVSERSDLSVQQRSKLAHITLRNELILIESKLQEEECRDEDLNSFEALANSCLSKDDEALNELAYFALAKVRTLKFCDEPSEGHRDHLVSGFREFAPGFQNNPTRTLYLLKRLMKAKQKNPNNAHIDHVIAELGSLMAESQNSSIKKIANAFAEDARFFGLQLWDLNERIRRGEDRSLQNFGNILKEVEQNPEISFKKWNQIVKCCESLLSIGDYKNFRVANDSISEIIGKLPDSCDFKPTLAAQVRMQKSRFELLGTPVTLPKKSLLDRQIKVKNRDVLLIFLDRTSGSNNLFSELQGQALDRYLPILVYRDDFSETDLEMVNFMPLGVKVADYESGSKLISSCFIDQYPYTIAVNKLGKIVGINLSLWQAARADAFEATK